MNLGIDFGSTYSSFATYDKRTNQAVVCHPIEGESPAVPSLACIGYDDEMLTGYSVRNHLNDDPDARLFSAFKMLLVESDETILRSQGYDRVYTPKKITEYFLRQQIRRILHTQKEPANNIVICVPETWTTKKAFKRNLQDGKTVLRDIIASMPEVNSVAVVSEPAAAGAYFSYYYRRKRQKPLEGMTLVIDYGGGTLDLTLTELIPSVADSTQIKVRFRTGEGENSYGRIGNAGIAYMENVMEKAISESNILGDQPVPRDSAFRKCVNVFESKLKEQYSKMSSESEEPLDVTDQNDSAYKLFFAVSDYADDISLLKENDEDFCKVRYHGKTVVVTYSQLYRAYEEVIEPVLDTCLTQTAEWMEAHHIDYARSVNAGFHVLLVGGFSKFIFVQKQVEDFFGSSATGDERFRYDLGANREYAVAMGAALLADGVVNIRRTAPFAIGVETTRPLDGASVQNYAITFRQEYETDKEYWIGGTEHPKQFLNPGNTMYSFLVGLDDYGKERELLSLKPIMRNKIKVAYTEIEEEYAKAYPNLSKIAIRHNIGFSMDESEVVTFLIRETKTGKVKRIELSSFSEMFELTESSSGGN